MEKDIRKLISWIIPIFVLSTILCACAPSAGLSRLPPIGEGIIPAELYIIRPRIFEGDALAGFIYIDDKPIFRIAAGDYTIIQVIPGEHTVRIMGKGWFDIVMNQLSVSCMSKGQYYLKVTNTEIEQISKEQAANYIARCSFVSFEVQD